MICIPQDKIAEIVAYFREQLPEFAAISDQTLTRLIKKSAIYIPEFVQTCVYRKYSCCDKRWTIMKEILINWVAHIIILTDLLAQANGEEAMPAELVRTANSLSEGGLSVSYAQAVPTGETPQAIFDYLTNTAYGVQAKMLIEACLTGAKGVLIV